MKYAILSDIHANPLAFKNALCDAREQGADKIICLGDITGYGYGALASYELAVGKCDVWLMGNHDAACAGILPVQEVICNPNYKVDCIARDELGMDRLEHIAALPYTHEESSFVCAHGAFSAPYSFAYIACERDAMIDFSYSSARLVFIGHTHKQETWCLTGSGRILRTEAAFLHLQPELRYIVNVGSVGYPRRDPFSSYAIYDDVAETIEIRRLPFDFRHYLDSFAGLPFQPPAWLLSGDTDSPED